MVLYVLQHSLQNNPYFGSVTFNDGNETNKKEEIKEPSKTLYEYVDNHSMEKLGCAGSGCGDLNFVSKEFKCSPTNDKKILYLSSKLMVLEDNSLYNVLIENEGKKFSNKEQCKKIDIDGNYKYVGEFKYNKPLFKYNNNYYFYSIKDDIYNEGFNKLSDNEYQNIVDIYNKNYKLIDNNFIIDNGNAYKINNNKKELLYSKEEYGDILDYKVASGIEKDHMYIDVEIQPTILITTKGVYTLNEIETEECMKYEDIKCEIKMVPSDIYNKFNKDIKFVNKNYAILSNNSVIDTRLLGYKLDDK